MSELLRTDCGLAGEPKERPGFDDQFQPAHVGCQADLRERLNDVLADDRFEDRFVFEVSSPAALCEAYR